MTYSKPFLAALAVLPLVTMSPSEAEAKPRCKTYTKTISYKGDRQAASARVCRDNNHEWYFDRLRGTGDARARLAEHIYFDLRDKGYGLLVDYIAYDNHDHRYDRDYYEDRYKDRHKERKKSRYTKTNHNRYAPISARDYHRSYTPFRVADNDCDHDDHQNHTRH